MAVFKIARYEVMDAHRAKVEAAERELADYVGKNIPGATWETYRDSDKPNRFVSLIWAQDQATEEKLRNAKGTRHFAELLFPEVVGEVEFRDYVLVASSKGEGVLVPHTAAVSGKEPAAKKSSGAKKKKASAIKTKKAAPTKKKSAPKKKR